MEHCARHRCMIYEGPPSRQLPSLAAVTREKLQENYRCLYLNSPPMVAGMRSYLAAAGVDVAQETKRNSLVLASEQHHLASGEEFDVQRMIDALKSGLDLALSQGYKGLWATGDMTWEFGPRNDFSKLLEYEWRLEEFLYSNPEMGGICQYRADILPRAAMRRGLLAHGRIFVNETLSMINPQFLHAERFSQQAAENFELDRFINKLIAQETLN
jgi:MEDS: MEthanogen/methylotroph, DcmR Sensory domain